MNMARKCLARISPQEENKTDLVVFHIINENYNFKVPFKSALFSYDGRVRYELAVFLTSVVPL